MKVLPLVPDGCSLTPAGLAEQRARAARVRPSVTAVERAPRSVRVRFDADVDTAVVERLVEAERGCCSFLELGWDGRELRVRAPEGTPADAVATIAGIFEEER